MNRRAFLLSALIAPFAAALAPTPQYVDFGLLQKLPWCVYTPPKELMDIKSFSLIIDDRFREIGESFESSIYATAE